MSDSARHGDTNGVVDEIDRKVRALLEAEGYDLVLVEYIKGSRILRMYIDRVNDDTGVTLDDCTRVSHLTSDFLDADGLSDRIEGSYHLEISSPGLDRPLVRPRDFVRFLGNAARVTTREPVAGRRKFKGSLVAADAEPQGGVRLVVDGGEHAIPYDLIHRARLIPDL